ncbi:MAG: hypothetical protein Q9170_001511 [Blastenia crenularia]
MLSSSLHLAELLRTRPKHVEAVEPSTSTSRHQWSPKKKLKPGRTHLIKFRTRYYVADRSSSGVAPTEAVNGARTPFQYGRKLGRRDEPPVIRLLNILPGSRGDPIVCDLYYLSPESPPYFEAISYCWGEQEASVTIECDRQPLKITPNLSAAINSFRHEDVSLLIWADAICIDQTSVEEKNAQVPLMRLIYQKAAVVQVWLGKDTPSKACQEAFNLLQELNRAYYKLKWEFSIFQKFSGGQSLKELSCNLPALSDLSWTSLVELVQRPWLARVWIIQEVAVSRSTIVRCGSSSLPWKDLCFGFLFAINAGFLSYQTDIFQHSIPYQQLIPLIVTYVCLAETHHRDFDLLSLLQSHRLAGASNARDKVYALLGLSSTLDSLPYEIMPDYSLSTTDVYTEVAREIILKSRTLDILGVPRSKTSSALVDRLPSWAPDWSVIHLTSSLSFKNLQGEYVFDFDAAKTNQAAAKINFGAGHSLILQGHVFDTVIQVGKVMIPFKSHVATAEGSRKQHNKSNACSPVRLGMLSSMLHVYAVQHD